MQFLGVTIGNFGGPFAAAVFTLFAIIGIVVLATVTWAVVRGRARRLRLALGTLAVLSALASGWFLTDQVYAHDGAQCPLGMGIKVIGKLGPELQTDDIDNSTDRHSVESCITRGRVNFGLSVALMTAAVGMTWAAVRKPLPSSAAVRRAATSGGQP